MEYPNYYKVLGVLSNASGDEITAAKNALAKVYHPDANLKDGIDTTEQMQMILEAYRVLSDPVTRADYDRKLSGRRPTMQTFDLREAEESPGRDEITFLTYWRASNDLYEIINKSRSLYRKRGQAARLGRLSMQAVRHILTLRGAQIPERYWHPDIMNWMLFTWFKNRNYTTAYLLALYDDHSKKDIRRIDRLKIMKKTNRYQQSVKKLMKY